MSNGGDYQGHWEDTPGIPYTGVDYSQIKSGVRPTLRACQYWIKGLSGICIYWLNGDPGDCTYEEVDSKGRSIYPSGWNNGHCDFLGRRTLCDKYKCRNTLDDEGKETEELDEDLDQYMCVAPDPFRTGLLKEVKAGMPLKLTGEKIAVPKADVKGYNEDITTDVGQCDGCGQGKGAIGFALSNEGKDYSLDSYKKLPVVCPYYKPWHMGFGAIQPKTTDIDGDGVKVDDKGRYITDEREELGQWLPSSFRIYNLRAKCQKCIHWDKDHGSEFILDAAGLYLESDAEDRSDFCTCTDGKASDYHTIDEDAFKNYEGYMLLENVWSKAGSVVCNGVKPECPCYTGDWVYCIDEKMMDGDKISAQQIMELRFWMKDWPSQEVYDKFFERKPNKNDPTTADIYTFAKWRALGAPSDAIMEGKKIHMCQPAAMWKKEFDSDLYLTIEDIIYPKANVDIGTTTETQVSFPSLVRDMERTIPYQFDVIYPYQCKNPFDVLENPVCGDPREQVCIKRANSIDGDSIQVVGYTVRGKAVYAFNIYYTGIASVEELEDYDDVLSIPDDIKEGFFRRLKIFIEDLIEAKQEYICMGTSVGGADADSGIFNIGPVPLKYQKMNEVIICVDFGVGWEFKKRNVWSQWYGGAVVQTKFDYTPSSYTSVPKYFSPSASAIGRLVPFSGPNFHGCYTQPSSAFSVYSYRHYSMFGNSKDYYAYCIKKITMKNKEVNQWVRIGQSSLIWVEIPDINLNYIFEWEVVEGTMTFNGEEEDVCGGTTTKMKIKYPTSWAEGQKYIPANVCILEPEDKEPRSFFHSKWTLTLTYKYTTLSSSVSDDEELVFPTGGYSVLCDSPHSVSSEGSSFTVTNIKMGTVAIMGYFTDENGRLMSTMATKMLTQVNRLECRNVEIFYRYKAMGKIYLLQPSSGFRNWVGADKATGGVLAHVETPPCGDHKCGFPCIGPIWFPFINCDTLNYYTWYAAGVSCTMSYEGLEEKKPDRNRPDYRYCGSHLYRAWVEPGGNWASACGVLWAYYYSNASSNPVSFVGYANIVGAIDVPYYNAMGWVLPYFGYGGREVNRKFLSQDFQSHVTFTVYPPKVISQWMPIVPDRPNFFMSFNAFEQKSLGSLLVAPDYFSHVHQLSFLCSDLIEEKVDYTRVRFEDIFGVRHRACCSYPPPLYEGSGGLSKVCYLYFKNENGAWAWQERWKSIERCVSDIYLAFVSEVIKPDYKNGYYKDEHRYICDEGTHILEYKAPQMDDDGNCTVAPSISLDGAFPRYFKILYDESNYSNECVEWMDEDVGQIDGSGGNEEPSIYEKTSGWSHFEDSTTGGLLFDVEAVKTINEAAEADREMIVGKDLFGDEIKKYYNRGIIVNIPKDRLNYLPYEEVPIEAPELTGEPCCDGSEIFTVEGLDACISKIVIKGVIGEGVVDDEFVEFREPNITVESFEPANWTFQSCADESNASGTISIEETPGGFVITMKILPTVIRMLTKKDQKISITIRPLTGYCTKVTEVKCFKAVYIDKIETIRTWERRYVTSTLSLSAGCTNANGPEDILTYAENFDNAGQYLPVLKHTEPYKCMDKMRIGAADEGHGIGDDIPLQINMDNLHQIEAEEQMTLYNTAYELDPSGTDDVTYTIICPIKFEQFFEDENMPCRMGGAAVFSVGQILWDDHYTVNSFMQYDFWRPGGHKFQWSDYTYEEKCMVLAFHMETLYNAEAIHVNHGGTQSVMDPGNALYSGRFIHIRNVYDRMMRWGGQAPVDRLNAHPAVGDWTFHT